MPADAHRRVVMSRQKITRNYLTGWFFIDLLSAVPFAELLTAPSTGFVQILKVGAAPPGSRLT